MGDRSGEGAGDGPRAERLGDGSIVERAGDGSSLERAGDRAGPPAPPITPPSADAIFGDRRSVAERYVELLATTGIDHGLIGPRERPILWTRHVLNCAVAQEAFPEGQRVADLGSGAGLPGLVLAIARPDLHLELIEPLHRRVVWLQAAIEELGLDNVVVHEARAEALSGVVQVDAVTARAVARLAQLAQWAFPLLPPGSRLVALKGARAQAELDEDHAALIRLGTASAEVRIVGAQLPEPTTLVEVTRGTGVGRRTARDRGRGTGRRGNR